MREYLLSDILEEFGDSAMMSRKSDNTLILEMPNCIIEKKDSNIVFRDKDRGKNILLSYCDGVKSFHDLIKSYFDYIDAGRDKHIVNLYRMYRIGVFGVLTSKCNNSNCSLSSESRKTIISVDDMTCKLELTYNGDISFTDMNNNTFLYSQFGYEFHNFCWLISSTFYYNSKSETEFSNIKVYISSLIAKEVSNNLNTSFNFVRLDRQAFKYIIKYKGYNFEVLCSAYFNDSNSQEVTYAIRVVCVNGLNSKELGKLDIIGVSDWKSFADKVANDIKSEYTDCRNLTDLASVVAKSAPTMCNKKVDIITNTVSNKEVILKVSGIKTQGVLSYSNNRYVFRAYTSNRLSEPAFGISSVPNCDIDKFLNQCARNFSEVINTSLKNDSFTAGADIDLSSVNVVALVYNDKKVGYRFKTTDNYFDISMTKAEELGLTAFRVTKKIDLEDHKGVLMSKSEYNKKSLVSDISSDNELCKRLINCLFS